MKLLRIKGALTLFLLQICFFSQGQTITQQLNPEEVANRITSVYGSDFLLQNPELITAFGEVINHHIEYVTKPYTSDEKFPLLSSIPLKTKNNPGIQGANFSNFNVMTFNPLVYSIEFFSNKTQVFRIDNTNYIMVVKPTITN